MLDQLVVAADRQPAARWQAVHRRCDPLGDDACELEVDRCRTVESVVALLLNVARKTWGQHTDAAAVAVRILVAGVGLSGR